MKYLNEEMLERSVACQGNCERLVKLMKRAEKGEELNICFLGGSITQGSLSSTPETCYAYLVYDWFVKKFPAAHLNYVNAGIGGTTSQFGSARLEEDVLSYAPDFCMVEFSVNDCANEFFRETYEAVIRRLLYSKTLPAVLIMNNLFYDTGRNAQEQHNEAAEHYCIPALSVRDAVYPEIEKGRISRQKITPDNLHPNDEGHAILAGTVTNFLEKIYCSYVEAAKAFEEEAFSVTEPGVAVEGDDYVRKSRPFTVNAEEELVRHQAGCAEVTVNGFTADASPKANVRDIFKRGWYSRKTGDSLKLTFFGSELAVQYRKTITQPAPVAIAVIDGDEQNPVVLDANFEETWGDSLHIDTLLYHGERVAPEMILKDSDPEKLKKLADRVPERAEHTIEIRISETHEGERSDFYLVSIITG